MATNTYVALDKAVGTGSSGTISFTSIPSTYTDLRIVMYATATNNTDYEVDMRYNNDSGNNYSLLYVQGNGTTATTNYYATQNKIRVGETSGTDTTYPTVITIDVMNYANTSVNKPCIIRYGEFQPTTSDTGGKVAVWASTSAINRIDLLNLGGNFTTITTATLYGIRAEGVSPAVKATGGTIYSDSTYYYHVFGSTGVFAPNQSLTADVLVLAGGGGGGTGNGGGGGAGGLRQLTSQSFTATNYTCTIGSGGNGHVANTNGRGSAGTNSSLIGGALSISATGGGAGGGGNTEAPTSGGSGGGGGTASATNGASGNAGGYSPVEGYAGGNAVNSGIYSSGGGGGAGAVGTNATASTTAPGGIGATSSLINAIGAATGTGVLLSSNYYFAGGGGGGADSGTTAVGGTGGGGNGSSGTGLAVAGQINTGGGGGGQGFSSAGAGGNGGSGVVIVRYLKA